MESSSLSQSKLSYKLYQSPDDGQGQVDDDTNSDIVPESVRQSLENSFEMECEEVNWRRLMPQ
jgi:hypothetical protein